MLRRRPRHRCETGVARAAGALVCARFFFSRELVLAGSRAAEQSNLKGGGEHVLRHRLRRSELVPFASAVTHDDAPIHPPDPAPAAGPARDGQFACGSQPANQVGRFFFAAAHLVGDQNRPIAAVERRRKNSRAAVEWEIRNAWWNDCESGTGLRIGMRKKASCFRRLLARALRQLRSETYKGYVSLRSKPGG